MHPSIKLKYKRYEAKIKELQKIVAKRNLLFHRIRKHYERPVVALQIMLKMEDLKEWLNSKEVEVIDYIILMGVKDKGMTFYMEDVENIILANQSFYLNRKHDAVRSLNRLIKLGFVRQYTFRKQDNYFITPEARLFLLEVGQKVSKIVRGTMR